MRNQWGQAPRISRWSRPCTCSGRSSRWSSPSASRSTPGVPAPPGRGSRPSGTWATRPTQPSVLYDPSLRFALTQSLKLALITMLIATPIGVALAIGLARWRGRGAKSSNFLMLFPLVTPEIVMGVALFLVFDNLYDFVPFGTVAQALGHITFSISFVVIIVRGRLFAIGRDYEEAAMDLGASPNEAMRRVLLPLLTPASAGLLRDRLRPLHRRLRDQPVPGGRGRHGDDPGSALLGSRVSPRHRRSMRSPPCSW